MTSEEIQRKLMRHRAIISLLETAEKISQIDRIDCAKLHIEYSVGPDEEKEIIEIDPGETRLILEKMLRNLRDKIDIVAREDVV